MKHPESKINLKAFNRNYGFLLLSSLASLTATFLVSNSAVTFQTKLVVFALIICTYLLIYSAIYFWRNKQTSRQSDENDSIFNAEIDGKLMALEEANQFFGASLKSADMFRLVASRINEIIPFSACAFFLADNKNEKLKIAYSGGDLKKFTGTEINWRQGLAGKVFHDEKSKIDKTPGFDKAVFPGEDLKNLKSAVAVPLLSGENVFGVFALYSENADEFNTNSLQLCEAVASRIAPIFLSSQAFENNLTSALTDALTNLPNERAFFLVLENQIAESQRFRDQRPLAILAVDIKKFGEHNQRFGHATGDRLLLFVADKIKQQLRQMDFLARSINDEFLVVLPTASEKITGEIVERIEKTFVLNSFEATEQEKIHLELCFGSASFGKDEETANDLLKHALIRKSQSKSNNAHSKVLWFPKEFVN